MAMLLTVQSVWQLYRKQAECQLSGGKKKKKKKGRRCHSETLKTLRVHSMVSYNMSNDERGENVDTDPWRNRYVIDAADYATLTGLFTEVYFGNYSNVLVKCAFVVYMRDQIIYFLKCVNIRRWETWNKRKASFISTCEALPNGFLTRQGLFGLLKGTSQVVNIICRACWNASFPWKHCDHELFQTFWFISVQDICLFHLLTRFVSRDRVCMTRDRCFVSISSLDNCQFVEKF